MIDNPVTFLVLAAAVGSALIGGLFFAFSTFIMGAFDRLPGDQAIAAMQSINVTVLNPVFFAVFFGTGALALGLAVFVVLDAAGTSSAFVLIGAAAYVLGSILVTILFNVPLNNVLAAVRIDNEDPEAAWRRYRELWTRWNHVRTLASLAAGAAFGAALTF